MLPRYSTVLGNAGLFMASPQNRIFPRARPLSSHAIVMQTPFRPTEGQWGENAHSGKVIEAVCVEREKPAGKKLERAKGFEPSTFTLAR